MHRLTLCIVLAAMAPAAVCAQQLDPVKDKPVKKKTERKKDEIIRLEGALTVKDPIDKLRPGYFHKVHEVEMVSAKTYVVEMIDKNRSGMDPFLRIEDAQGNILAQDDDSGGNQNARIIFPPTKDDKYRIVATTFGAGAVGAYQIIVQPVARGSVTPGGGFGAGLLIPVDYGDISITPLPAWGGSTNQGGNDPETHGYVEYRFVIENYSETESHRVKLTLPRNNTYYRMGHYLQGLRKAVDVAPGATVQISLFQLDLPLMGNDAEVEIDGRLSNRHVSFGQPPQRGTRTNQFYYGGGQRSTTMPLVLVPGDEMNNSLRQHAYKSAVGVVTKPPTGGGYSSSGGVYNEPGKYFNKAYTYFENTRFRMALTNFDTWSRNWLGYSSFDGVAMTGDNWLSTPPEVQAAITHYVECGGSLLLVGPGKLPETWQRFKEEKPGFDVYHPGFGRCMVSKKINAQTKKVDVAAWDPDDWRLVMNMWQQPLPAWWQLRSPTAANVEFPIVEGITIPVRGLFVAMFLFVVLIGPVNVYWLSRSKRRIWLLWTVPVFSLATCVLLLAYMLITEGWHGHVRVDGVTVLDENSQHATSIGWHGYYCPTTPAGGLRFGAEVELSPHLNFGRSYNVSRHPYTMDWSTDQQLAEGWMTAKVPMHFLVRRHEEKRRERVTVRKNDDGTLVAGNSLGADIRSLHLATADGKVHVASNILAGSEATLQPSAEKTHGRLNKLSESFAGIWTDAAEGMAKNPSDYLRPGSYVAVLDAAPFVEQGLRHTQSRKLRTVVFGILKDAP